MANTDAFSAQIVNYVRNMPDEAILDLVKHQLGVVTSAMASPPRRRGRPPRAASASGAAAPRTGAGRRGRPSASAKRRPGRPRKTATASAERQESLNAIEKIVKSSSGISASEVARSAGVPQTRAAQALKELKLAKRIYQGGDRRFARYAGDARTAEQASVNARKTASGPAVGKKSSRRGRRKGS